MLWFAQHYVTENTRRLLLIRLLFWFASDYLIVQQNFSVTFVNSSDLINPITSGCSWMVFGCQRRNFCYLIACFFLSKKTSSFLVHQNVWKVKNNCLFIQRKVKKLLWAMPGRPSPQEESPEVGGDYIFNWKTSFTEYVPEMDFNI